MRIGTAIFLIALGAILYYAVNRKNVEGVEIDTIGVILMIVGVLGLIISLIFEFAVRDRDRGRAVVEEHPVRERRPRDRY